MRHRTRILTLGVTVLVTALAIACGGGDDNTQTKGTAAPAATQAAATRAVTGGATAAAARAGYTPKKSASSVSLNGAGATFPAPFYTKAFDEYNKFDPKVKVNYQAIGSGGGIKNFTEKTVDFGATDAYMTEKQIADAGGPEAVIHIPTALGSVVLTWNLPGYTGGLKLSPELLADIYLGEIKKWNDSRIKAENVGASLPDAEIALVYRSDGSGTTNTFTSYLSLVSDKWKSAVGSGTTVKWPAGIGASGNDGVAGQIKQTPGAFGYVELVYAEQNKLPTAELKNKAGTYVKPSPQSTAAAAADTSAVKDDLSANLLNAAGDKAYPIVTMTWILAYRNYTDELKGNAIVNLLWWLTHDGQKVAEQLQYAPLPREVVATIEGKLKLITAAGRPVIAS